MRAGMQREMISFRDRLKSGRVILSDGAAGTELMARGLRAGQCPDAWNLTRAATIEELARQYSAAGAEIIQTNTFGANPLKLDGYGLADQTELINEAGVRIARRAAGDRAYVVACCGPSGKILKPYGDTPPEAVQAGYERQLRALVAAGIDAVNFETMIDLAEAVLAVKAVRAVAPELPVGVTMTFEQQRKGFFTVMGNSLVQVAGVLDDCGVDFLGANCGTGSAMMKAVARELRAATRRPVSIRPNAGLPEILHGRTSYPETPVFMARKLLDLLDAGVTIVGGCCGTTPAHIRAFRATIDARRDS